MKTYRIKDWDRLYETNRTRVVVDMRWHKQPNNYDGCGYTAMVEGPDGPAIYGAWVTILGTAAKCRPRGTLVRSGGTPHTATSLARVTRMTPELMQKTLDRASHPEIGWLEIIETEAGPPATAPDPAPTRHYDVTTAAPPCHNDVTSVRPNEVPRVEEKRVEEKRETSSLGVAPPKAKFAPPSQGESQKYGFEIGLTPEDCQQWRDHFLANGWVVGKARAPMKDWQATMRTWKSHRAQFAPTVNGRPRIVADHSKGF